MIIYNGEHDKTPYKNVFGDTMMEIVKSDRDVIYLDADLTNSIGTHKLWKEYPEQAFNCGIAEADMIGIAGGLSISGKKPYAHSFAPFASRRCFDQTFLSIGYAGGNLRLIGSDAGVTAAFNGGTHMPFEDLALMRVIPGATVIECSDGAQLKWVLWNTKDRGGVNYIRISRKTYPALYSDDHKFEIGKGNVLRDGSDATVFAIGLMVGEAMKAAVDLEKEGVSVRVVDMFTVKPIDKELVAKCAAETGAIVTAENHNVIGGLGDAVGAALLEGKAVPFEKVGVQDRFGQVGPPEYLQEQYGLTADEVAKAVKRTISRK